MAPFLWRLFLAWLRRAAPRAHTRDGSRMAPFPGPGLCICAVRAVTVQSAAREAAVGWLL
eukprot:10543098-Alexandrium_andersonii.AAC.1